MKPIRAFVVCSASALMVLAFASSPALAHHSATATYLHGQVVKIEGTLKEFIWRNPHSFMKVEATDAKGEKQIWVIEGAAPQQLTESGLRTNTFRPGDKLRSIRAGPGKGTRHVQRQVGFNQSVNLRRDGFHR